MPKALINSAVMLKYMEDRNINVNGSVQKIFKSHLLTATMFCCYWVCLAELPCLILLNEEY